VSKNVAVFVDVANIFYAAKAAGVDIDYVTLLKAAIAGRDFVRAYAYTGLDPENDNQRQFHAFLARSGYKVVSKDVRKYGDGKIKANLDIELVVDMMRTARNLDVAVVVSGDGDFAPAIRAVQQEGVRVEVISFRGNTSSDLIEVADVFTDITQIARVEKGSRSGRRVAAEDDLSMTEVPDKETEGAPRRRRGGVRARPERTPRETPAVATTATGASLTVLPGEKLSRVAGDGEAPEADTDELGETVAATAGNGLAADADAEGDGAAGRRRRRRRGGRGRGRGRGGEREPGAALQEPAEEDEDGGPEYEAPRLPQHSTFGSVWDSQLGVSQPSPLAAGGVDEQEGDEDEPEIPEYLLSERRQRAQRGPVRGGRGGGRAAAYQSAVERERYGRGGMSSFGAPRREAPPRRDGAPRRDDRGRPPGRGRPPQRRPQDRLPSMPPQSPGSDPWSEVPPELEEMLRAQLATRPSPGGRPSEAAASSSSEVSASSEAPAEEEAASSPRTTRRTTTRRTAKTSDPEAGATEEAPAPKRRAATKRTTSSRSSAKAGDDAEATGSTDAEAPKPTRRRTTRKAASTPASAESPAEE
jgi:uncharacterized LabA/DUF88 family protein